ncbi:GrpB domain protein [Aspergillus floccosus]
MPFSSDITKHMPYDPLAIETVATRKNKPVEIVEYNPEWKTRFQVISQKIQDALGDRALSVAHVGSTSVPGLPAKDVIDVDVVVADPTAEENYVPALEAAGFQFLFREPKWHEHRFFSLADPYANIHVFGPDSPELVRHRLFRDWLLTHEDDRNLYVDAKRRAAAESRREGDTVQQYNDRKEPVIREILRRVYLAHGLIPAELN